MRIRERYRCGAQSSPCSRNSSMASRAAAPFTCVAAAIDSERWYACTCRVCARARACCCRGAGEDTAAAADTPKIACGAGRARHERRAGDDALLDCLQDAPISRRADAEVIGHHQRARVHATPAAAMSLAIVLAPRSRGRGTSSGFISRFKSLPNWQRQARSHAKWQCQSAGTCQCHGRMCRENISRPL